MSEARVLLTRLSVRTSARGNEYLVGPLGNARLVGFKSREPDKYGNEQWELYVAEPPPKREHEPASTDALPRGETRVHRTQRRDPREEHVDELASRFQPDTEIPF
jgi:hypothetical protein